MHPRAKHWLLFTLRWGIALAGIWWIVSNISLYDQVTVVSADGDLVSRRLLQTPPEASAEALQSYHIVDPATGRPAVIDRRQTANRPDRPAVTYRAPGAAAKEVELLGLDLGPQLDRNARPQAFLVRLSDGPQWVSPELIAGGTDYQVRVPYPRVDLGLVHLVRNARPSLLWAAVLIFPTTFIICSYRWHELLRALSICMGWGRAFVLTMVGSFYNSFMPGSTGGDLLKAYYAAKHTHLHTRAVMSVAIDRIIGLVALVIMGGMMAGVEYYRIGDPDDPVARASGHVALAALALVGGLCLVLVAFFAAPLRRMLGLDYFLGQLPMQRQVQKAIETMAIYRQRPGLVLGMILITFPVHITVVLSAMLAGKAFGLPISTPYYFVAVPVIVLSGALPISPQGAGVMEFFAVQLTQREGATIGQAFALTMSIRLVQLLWNLIGGIYVFRGGYHAPSASEQQSLGLDEPALPASPGLPPG